MGSKDAVDRVPLNCLGPWHQLHGDGHEKLGSQALEMGGVCLPIYAFKDQYSTFVPLMRVLPDVHLKNTIGHLYWDLADLHRCKSQLLMLCYNNSTLSTGIFPQLTIDKGSEQMVMFQQQLRYVCSSSILNSSLSITFVQVRSSSGLLCRGLATICPGTEQAQYTY